MYPQHGHYACHSDNPEDDTAFPHRYLTAEATLELRRALGSIFVGCWGTKRPPHPEEQSNGLYTRTGLQVLGQQRSGPKVTRVWTRVASKQFGRVLANPVK